MFEQILRQKHITKNTILTDQNTHFNKTKTTKYYTVSVSSPFPHHLLTLSSPFARHFLTLSSPFAHPFLTLCSPFAHHLLALCPPLPPSPFAHLPIAFRKPLTLPALKIAIIKITIHNFLSCRSPRTNRLFHQINLELFIPHWVQKFLHDFVPMFLIKTPSSNGRF